MLKRLGMVAWWVGCLALLMGLTAGVVAMSGYRRCSALADELSAVEKHEAQTAASRVSSAASRASGMALSIFDQFEIDASSLTPRGDKLRQLVPACQKEGFGWVVIVTILGAIWLIGWASSFVLAGSFWQPVSAIDGR